MTDYTIKRNLKALYIKILLKHKIS